jgi:hypothetical protein
MVSPVTLLLRSVVSAVPLLLMVSNPVLANSDGAPADTSCLIVQTGAVTPENRMLHGVVKNTCGQAITSVTIDVDVSYTDGTRKTYVGARDEFYQSAEYGEVGRAATRGRGMIEPGELRELHSRQIPQPQNSEGRISSSIVTISSIIFDDASAVGNRALIDEAFQQRRYELEEYKFWRARVGALQRTGRRPERAGVNVLAAEIRQRADSVAAPAHKLAISAIGGEVGKTLAGLLQTSTDQDISVRLSVLDAHLGRMIENAEKHSVERRQ